MKIKDIANLAEISKESIRYYEFLGLLKPVRNQNGYREYSDSDLNDLFFILNLKKLNLKLDEIQILMALKNQETLNFLDTHINILKEKIAFMEQSLKILEKIESIVSSSDGIKDEEKIIPLLKKFEGESL
jgi:DNA-binding transcriptional MerR regulator